MMLRKTWAAMMRLDDHWLGDLLGVVALFGGLYAALFLGAVLDGGGQ